MIDYDKVLKDYKTGICLEDKKEYIKYYSILQSLIWDNEIDKFNEVLRNINIQKSSLLMLVGILRTAWMKSDEIKSYNEMLFKISEELEKRGENSAQMLHGLNGKLTEVMKKSNENFILQLRLRNPKN